MNEPVVVAAEEVRQWVAEAAQASAALQAAVAFSDWERAEQGLAERARLIARFESALPLRETMRGRPRDMARHAPARPAGARPDDAFDAARLLGPLLAIDRRTGILLERKRDELVAALRKVHTGRKWAGSRGKWA